MDSKRVENHTDRLIFLPPINAVEQEEGDLIDFPRGIRLEPGLNTVPVLYLDALHAQQRAVHDKYGRARKGRNGEGLVRYPGREVLAQLTAPVNHTTSAGRVFGAQITVYEDAVARADGPRSPETLPSNIAAAQALVLVTEDRNVLRRWLSQTKDVGLKSIIQSRIAAVPG